MTAVTEVRIDAPDGARTDRVAVEAPLELRIGGKATTVLMRTPGEDEELVTGFLFTEGLIGRAADVVALRRPDGLTGDERGNVIAVELAPDVTPPPYERAFYSSASCGVCGKTPIACHLAPRTPSPLPASTSIGRAAGLLEAAG